MSSDAAERPVALVTGANRGIGYEVCRQLAGKGYAVLLAARDAAKGTEAAAALAAEGLNVRAPSLPLDVTDPAGVAVFAEEIARTPGRLDVLVNNAAAVAGWSETASTADLDAARALFDANLFGGWRVTQALLPLLRRSEHPRIVFVSSGAGSHADTDFGLTTGRGSVASYGVSKAAVNALVAKFAAELEGTGVLVNAVCPGLTATAPGMEAMGARPVAEGAAGIVWAATLPDGGPTGGFFRDGKPIPW
jgi:NAD(P)-dependent dehydrogenase (short-subunit alcohol dehydrogenase family)